MTDRLTTLFSSATDKVLSIYTTAGFPELKDTTHVCKTLQNSGVQMIELGFPFSDPLADGPIIQMSSEQSLKNGMTLDVLFSQLSEFRTEIHIPVLLMGYLNPVIQYGLESFFAQCAQVGVDGLIIPDLPLEEYEKNYRTYYEKYNLKSVFLITPQTSPDRIRKIDSFCTGFIYVVSVASVTGQKLNVDQERAFRTCLIQ